MKKNKNKGFVLAEVIAVSAVVIAALIIIYVQFVKIINGYNISFKYNTVEDLYSINNVKNYMFTDGYDDLVTSLNSEYIDITNCSSTYFMEYQYCEGLLRNLKIKTLLFTKEDTTDIVSSLSTNNPYSEGLKKFISNINSKNEENTYRLIAEFEDGTYSSLKMVGE